MALFDFWNKKTAQKSAFSNLSDYNTIVEKLGNSYFYNISTLFETNEKIKDFLEVPELNAVINIKAKAMASCKLEVVSIKTGEPAAANESLVRILRSPNWFQGRSEFWKQTEIYRSIYGNEYIYLNTPFGMPNSYKGMYTFDPSNINIEYNGDAKYWLEVSNENVNYYYNFKNGTKVPIDKNYLIHLNDNRVKKTDFIKGTSKLESLRPAINNIKAAYKKRNIALNLPIGVFGSSTTDAIGTALMDGDEKKNLIQKLLSKKGTPIVSELGLAYTSLANSPTNMGLFEEVREDTAKICDAYGVPYEVLASQKGVTFANLKEAKKQMYEENIIPAMQEKIDALNAKVAEGKSWQLQATWSHLPVFSEDVKNRASSMKMMSDALINLYDKGILTQEQVRNELNNNFNIK